jgi:hypothetical protein
VVRLGESADLSVLLLRWYFRLMIWIRFLWQVSRIQLALVPTHPDQLGGLGFPGNTVYGFSVLLIAHGAMLAAQIANRIFFAAAALQDFKGEIALMVGFLLCIVFGPLLVFSPHLAQTKRRGLNEYGTLAERYVREFDGKWLRGGAQGSEAFLGSADIQSLADMGNSFSVVRTMRIAPRLRAAHGRRWRVQYPCRLSIIWLGTDRSGESSWRCAMSAFGTQRQ